MAFKNTNLPASMGIEHRGSYTYANEEHLFIYDTLFIHKEKWWPKRLDFSSIKARQGKATLFI